MLTENELEELLELNLNKDDNKHKRETFKFGGLE